MQLPQHILPYARGLLWASRATTTHLSRLVNKSHDFLTRSVKRKVHWKKILLTFLLHVDLSEGYLVIDESEIDKSYSKKIQGASWLYSHLKSGYLFGLQIVLICWTNDRIKVPLGWKIYKKQCKTKTDLAIDLLDYTLEIVPKPMGVLFDSFYSSEKILKYISCKGLLFYSQVAKNRLLDGKQVQEISKRKYWERRGCLNGGIYVCLARNRDKYFISNDTVKTRKEICGVYSIRWRIEEIFRFIKSELNLESCQMRSLDSQNTHLGVCLYLFCVLQDTAEKTQMTEYSIREDILIDRSFTLFLSIQALLG